MKYSFLVVFCLLMACSTDEKKIEIREEWVDLVFDIQTARIAVERTAQEDRDSVASAYHRQILELHDMSEEEFDELTDYLYAQPSLMDSIYVKVNHLVDSLKSLSDGIQ